MNTRNENADASVKQQGSVDQRISFTKRNTVIIVAASLVLLDMEIHSN